MTETTDSPQPLIHAHELCFAVSGKTILDEVDFDIYPGEVIGLLGPQGAGKTTLLHICLGRLRATSGGVLVFGGQPSELGERRGWIGYAPQKASSDYPPQIPAIEYVIDGVTPQSLARRRSPDTGQRAQEALTMAGLDGQAAQTMGALDETGFWRLRLARALVNGPKLLILDDLGADLGGDERFALMEDAVRIAREGGMALLLVARAPKPLVDLVDQVVCLSRELLFRGQPASLTSEILEVVYA